MPQTQLDDEVFKTAQRRAAGAGYPSVEAYIADIVEHDLSADEPCEIPDLDRLFTPQRLVHIDSALADVKAGHFNTMEQANDELAKRRAEWLHNGLPFSHCACGADLAMER